MLHLVETDLETWKALKAIREPKVLCDMGYSSAAHSCAMGKPVIQFILQNGDELVFAKDLKRILRNHDERTAEGK